VGLWFAALFRALWIILLTLAILAVLGFAADVVLHRVTRGSQSASVYTHIYEVDVVIDGDGSVAITGTSSATHRVNLSESDNSTMFGHPQRAVSVIGGTLFVSVRCPDSYCSSNLVFAASTIALIPVIVVFLAFQRQFVRGLDVHNLEEQHFWEWMGKEFGVRPVG